ncbi:cation/cationic drug transporter [Desulfitobacterium dichloroeliminans LMG P-21439]|uniref:Cation/cationic drug transporter n=1 Tax=Desulfitobacterium dichloroeliminans (strain LMG P-21439 / DCA1) TaxID=871963 RepID=L0F253_DESDL|nr:SMR family transporter [Desulfitobacterium dichloroeliminans]AGA67929.1 cation/cationic drug transporter [Desulfitobacterium dichloroeliminans LMG P-21439]
MGYLYLAFGLLGEVAGTAFLKSSSGFSVLIPTVLCVLSYIVCNLFIAKSLFTIKMSVAYATWYGAAVGIAALLSVFAYHESISPMAVVGLVLIIGGIVLANIGDVNEKSESVPNVNKEG